MIVVDTNIIVNFCIQAKQSEQARAIYDHDSVWVMPELWQHEFLNVLATFLRFEKAALESLNEAWLFAINHFRQSTMAINMPLALKLAGELNISAYDSQYLTLAQTLNVPLITEDKELLKKAPKSAYSMKAFLTQHY